MKHPTDVTGWIGFQTSLEARIAERPSDRGEASPIRQELMQGWYSKGLSPEEWAARNAQNVGSFSMGEYRYSDPALDRWVHRLDAIFFTKGAVEACRRHFLTDEEMRAVLAREAEPW
jgi:hypothetical protein